MEFQTLNFEKKKSDFGCKFQNVSKSATPFCDYACFLDYFFCFHLLFFAKSPHSKKALMKRFRVGSSSSSSFEAGKVGLGLTRICKPNLEWGRSHPNPGSAVGDPAFPHGVVSLEFRNPRLGRVNQNNLATQIRVDFQPNPNAGSGVGVNPNLATQGLWLGSTPTPNPGSGISLEFRNRVGVGVNRVGVQPQPQPRVLATKSPVMKLSASVSCWTHDSLQRVSLASAQH